MFRYKIRTIRLGNGVEISPGKLTVIVGPNNSGKSRLLRDVRELCTSRNPNTVVVQEVEHTRPVNLIELRKAYDLYPEVEENTGNVVLRPLDADMRSPAHVPISGPNPDWHNQFDSTIQHVLDNWNPYNAAMFAYYFGHYFVARLTTESRLTITKEGPSGDPQRGETQNLLQAFFREGRGAEERLSELVNSAFEELRVKLDYTGLSNLRFRVGQSFDGVPDDPRDARPIMETYDKLDDQGDGIRSFVATVLSLLVGNRPVLLLDEPEAFLHPPQALQLGATIANEVSDHRQIIVATHSVDLLRGILSKRADIDILRLSRNGNSTKSTKLSSEDVRGIANDPLLSSTRILDGLFYKGVVVVEADSDSAFYQRVVRGARPGDEIHYAHAHNKQTIHKVVAPYEKMGVKVAAVTDFDILKRGDEFLRLLQAKTNDSISEIAEAQERIRAEVEGTPLSEKIIDLRNSLEELAQIEEEDSTLEEPNEAEVLSALKRRVKRAWEEADTWARCKEKGREALSNEGRANFDLINSFCKERGLFIVPVGELESWLVPFGLEKSNQKSTWITQALQKLSEIDLPSDSDLIKFVQEIHRYLLS